MVVSWRLTTRCRRNSKIYCKRPKCLPQCCSGGEVGGGRLGDLLGYGFGLCFALGDEWDGGGILKKKAEDFAVLDDEAWVGAGARELDFDKTGIIPKSLCFQTISIFFISVFICVHPVHLWLMVSVVAMQQLALFMLFEALDVFLAALFYVFAVRPVLGELI